MNQTVHLLVALCALMLMLALPGCGTPAAKPTAADQRADGSRDASRSQGSLIETRTSAAMQIAPDIDAPKDPRPAIDVVFQVEIHQLTLPMGAVSQNSEFWSRLNEQRLDPATYDILQRNGIRVGEATLADWGYFKNIIEQHPTTATQSVSIGREVKNVELVMKSDIDVQDIWHFDRRNALTGRSFDHSDNLFSVEFQPTPRRAGWMRLAVSPVVRAERKRLEFNVLNEQRPEVQYARREMIISCNLRLDVPYQSFIVIAPSPEASWPLSVGHAFLIKQGESEMKEQVLIIVPKPRQI